MGILHSWDKCQLWPVLCTQFLGLLVDMAAGRLIVPQYKLDRFEQHASLACEGDADAWRTALGELASFTPALRLSRMLGRWLREWSGSGTPDSVWAAQILQFYCDALPPVNAKAWRADIVPAVPVVSDASVRAYGAYKPGSSWQATQPFRPSEAELGSTVREVRGARLAVAELLRAQQLVGKQVQVWVHSPALVHDQHLQLWLDSQGAVSACTNERGNAAVFAEVKALLMLAIEHGIPAQFRVAPLHHACRAKGGCAFQASGSQRLAARARVCAATNV